MKTVKCKSGLKGWQDKLQKQYLSLKEFKAYCETYNIHKRLGFKTIKAAWDANPTIQGSTDPSDLSIVYFHVIQKDGKFSVKESTARFAVMLPYSISCFMSKDLAEYVLDDVKKNSELFK